MRRSRDSGIKSDTFPFLNVMIGMIVILMLFMLMIVTTRAMTQQEQIHEIIAVAISPKPGDSQTPDSAGGDTGEGDLTDEQYRALRGELDQLASRLVEQKRRLKSLADAKTELESLIQSKEDEVNLAALAGDGEIGGFVVGQPEPTVMMADSTVTISKKPRYVEIDAENYIFYLEGGPRQFPTDQLTKSTPLDQEIQTIDARRSSEYLLFLIHPNGTKAYGDLRKYLFTNYQESTRAPHPFIPGVIVITTKSRISAGSEPFSNEWLLVANPKAE